jgi:glycerate kinase
VHVVIAPDKFKGSLTAVQAADAIASGVLSASPTASVHALPVADGGEGTVEAVVAAGFTRCELTVRGPTGTAVEAAYALRGGTAVIEMAEASGLGRLPDAEPAPLTASTYGTGQLVAAALDAGARSIVLGIGGSATTDGGAGMAQALGARLLDGSGAELAPGGAALVDLDRIDVGGLDPRIAAAEVTVACDVDSPLVGPAGAAAVYGPQKGASERDVAVLDAGLGRLAEVVRRDLGIDVAQLPGAGAAGGLGGGAVCFVRAELTSGIDLLLDLLGVHEAIRGADLVVTGEGSLDEQSLAGKAPVGVARAASPLGVPVVALCGRVAVAPADLHGAGIGKAWSLLDLEPDIDRAQRGAYALLARLAERAVRDFLTTHERSDPHTRPERTASQT